MSEIEGLLRQYTWVKTKYYKIQHVPPLPDEQISQMVASDLEHLLRYHRTVCMEQRWPLRHVLENGIRTYRGFIEMYEGRLAKKMKVQSNPQKTRYLP